MTVLGKTDSSGKMGNSRISLKILSFSKEILTFNYNIKTEWR